MIELPEVYVLAEQIDQTLIGKRIKNTAANVFPHGFATYSGDPDAYGGMLAGKKITGVRADIGSMDIWDCNVEITCEDMLLSISTPIKYHAPGEKLPKSYQLLLQFDDDSYMSCTVQMWGSMLCVPLVGDLQRRELGPNPLSEAFDEIYFDHLWNSVKPSMSAKAFLATQKRIPGLANGVLQDILFNAQIHPRRKLQTMNEEDKKRLYNSIKTTLKDMKDHGGRDTEKDLFDRAGGYKTILSKKTMKYPCPVCKNGLIRESYLGGNIYYCPTCQPDIR